MDKRRWGKAGVRLTDAQADANQRRAAKRHRELMETAARDYTEAHDAWRRGLIIPREISIALDLNGLYGPEVDIACKAEEPAVDMWEAAELYPTWEQLQAVAELTGMPLRRFWKEIVPINPVRGLAGFMCGPRGGCKPIPEDNRPVRYPRAVVAECPGTYWHEVANA